LDLPSEAALIISDKKFTKQSLVMSFLQKKFIDPSNYKTSRWGSYKGGEFINWRNELLKNNISNFDLDYNKGLVFSSIKGEKITYESKVNTPGDYFLAVRYISPIKSSKLAVNIDNNQITLPQAKNSSFNWEILGPFRLGKGTQETIFENLSGFNAINTFALISEIDLREAETKALNLQKRFQTLFLEENSSEIKKMLTATQSSDIKYKQKDPTSYTINISKIPTWVLFTDHYSDNWLVSGNKTHQSFPAYSMVNGFWIDDQQGGELLLEYTPQRVIPAALYVSFISGTVVILILILLKLKKRASSLLHK